MNFKTPLRILLLTPIALLLGLSSCKKGGKEDNTIFNRRIAMEGQDNFRDLGGYRGAEGKQVAYGTLFRSGKLTELTEGDVILLEELGIQNVIDLRTEQEYTEEPDILPPGFNSYFNLPLVDTIGLGDNPSSLEGQMAAILPMAAVLAGLDKRISETYMLPFYQNITELQIRSWTTLFDILEKGEKNLWHCTAGKDRAGMTTALVLYSLGVDLDTIMEDYLLTNDYRSAFYSETYDRTYQAALGYLQKGGGTYASLRQVIKIMARGNETREASLLAGWEALYGKGDLGEEEMNNIASALAEDIAHIGANVEERWLNAFFQGVMDYSGESTITAALDTLLVDLEVDIAAMRSLYLL